MLEQILSGDYPDGSPLPPEAEIAAATGVSRLTAREAIKMLQAHNIVTVRHGVGSFINPPSRWTALDAVVRATARGVGAGEVALKLLETRRLVEVGAAELAAERRSEDDLDALDRHLEAMRQAFASRDVAEFTDADIAFHERVLTATGNPFIPALLGPLSALLHTTRSETSAFREIQEHAMRHHAIVLDAIRSADPVRARAAMTDHIAQTYADYERYLSVRSAS